MPTQPLPPPPPSSHAAAASRPHGLHLKMFSQKGDTESQLKKNCSIIARKTPRVNMPQPRCPLLGSRGRGVQAPQPSRTAAAAAAVCCQRQPRLSADLHVPQAAVPPQHQPSPWQGRAAGGAAAAAQTGSGLPSLPLAAAAQPGTGTRQLVGVWR